MFIAGIDYTRYTESSLGSGTFRIRDGGTFISVELTEPEILQLASLALKLFEARQQSIAGSISLMRPAALPSPEIVDAEHKEIDDGVSF